MNTIAQGISRKTALEMLQRMRNDYHSFDLFEQLCQDDPTILARYDALLSIVGSNVNIWTDTLPTEQSTSQSTLQTSPLPSAAPSTPKLPPITSIWDYRSELLKLYILGKLANTTAAFQQEIKDTEQRIEDFGNRHRKHKKISAQQLLENERKKTLVGFGTRVADAQLLFTTNSYASKQEMEDLKKEIYQTENSHLELNLWRIRKIANQHYFNLHKKYRNISRS